MDPILTPQGPVKLFDKPKTRYSQGFIGINGVDGAAEFLEIAIFRDNAYKLGLQYI